LSSQVVKMFAKIIHDMMILMMLSDVFYVMICC